MARAFGRGRPEPVQPEGIEPPALEPKPERDEAQAPEEAAWLDAAVEKFERRLAEVLKHAGDDLYAQVERDLAAAEERMRENEQRMVQTVSERLEGAVAELRVQGDAQLADELERVKETAEAPLASIRKVEAEAVRKSESAASRAEKATAKAAEQMEAAAEQLSMRARRQELKLVREENSKRMTGALARLERLAELRMGELEAVRAEAERLLVEVDDRVAAAASAAAELERRLDETGERLAEAESRAESTGALIRNAVARLEETIASVEEAERRVLEIGGRVGATARRIAELGEHAERAVDWEGRMEAATRSEADAAQRITEAERRLLERVDPGAEPS
jgi:chromosome segregation ATPase